MRMHLGMSMAVSFLAISVSAAAASLLSRGEAEQDALKAVHGGNITQVELEKRLGRIIWSVDVEKANRELEVWIDAHTGAALKVVSHPEQSDGHYISQGDADRDAINADDGGEVAHSQRDDWNGYEVWDVSVVKDGKDDEFFLDARNGSVLKMIRQSDPGSQDEATSTGPLAASAAARAKPKMISKAQAQKTALNAVGGGTIVLTVLERSDTPPNWSVDIVARNGNEYEVKVNLYTGKVIAVIVGG